MISCCLYTEINNIRKKYCCYVWKIFCLKFCDTSVKKMKNSPFSLNSSIEECSRCSLLRYHWLGFCITRKVEGQKQGRKSITSISLKASNAFSSAFYSCFPKGIKKKKKKDISWSLCIWWNLISKEHFYSTGETMLVKWWESCKLYTVGSTTRSLWSILGLIHKH